MSEGEHVLHALGGPEPLCASVERLWEFVASSLAHITVYHVLLANHSDRLPPLHPFDGPPEPRLAGQLRHADRALTSVPASVPRPLVQEARDTQQAEALCRHLPGPFRVALAAEAVARAATVEAWERIGEAELADVHRIVSELVAAATGGQVRVDVSPWHTGALGADGTVLVPPTWFSHVWAIGAAVIDRCLVLHLAPTSATSAVARLRARDGTHTRSAAIHRASDGRWVS